MMTGKMDKAIRGAGGKQARDAVSIFFKKKAPEEGESSKLRAEIDEIKAAIEENRLDLKYNEAIERLNALEKELNERGNQA